MNRVDILLRAKIQEWLSKEKHSVTELEAGAMMALQCNRNRAMYNTIMRKPANYEGKIAYELKKHLKYLQDGINLDEVKELESSILPVIGQAIVETEKTADMDDDGKEENEDDICLPYPADSEDETAAVIVRGKREDHDTLPEPIRAIWQRNASRYKKIRQAHETCKTLTAACDRYEYTKAMAEMWEEYKKDFDTYDHYVPVPAGEVQEQPSDGAEQPLSAEDLKAVNAARPYISKNLPKLLALMAGGEEGKEDMADGLREKIQQRVDVLMRTGQVIKDELRNQLAEAGIDLGNTEQDGERKEHSDDTETAEQL